MRKLPGMITPKYCIVPNGTMRSCIVAVGTMSSGDMQRTIWYDEILIVAVGTMRKRMI